MRQGLWKGCAVGLWILCLCWIWAVPVHAEETEGNVVANRQEFYKGLSQQILAHNESEIYITDVGSLGNDMQEVLDGYCYFHDVDNPLASGSYLCNYLDSYSMEWREGGRYGDNHNCKIEVMVEYKYSKEEMDAYFGKMHELALTLKKDTDYKSVKAVHDYIIKEYEYDRSKENRIDYEGYKTGKMVCVGYCMAAFYLLSDMGIPVRIVLGASEDYQKDPDHAWNVVKVEGKWYNMDVTWDDQGRWRLPSYNFFLKNDVDFYKHTREGRYDYDNDMALSSYSMTNPADVFYGCIGCVVIAAVGISVWIQRKKKEQEKMGQVIIVEDDLHLEE